MPSSRVKRSKKSSGNLYMRSYTGGCMSSDWLSENVTLANRDTGIWRDSECILLGLLDLSRCDPIG